MEENPDSSATWDMESALAKVKAMGYDHVELAGGRYDRTGPQMAALFEKHGLQCISVHQSPAFFREDPEEAVDYVRQIGAPFCVIPICRLPSYREDWTGTVDLFTRMGQAFSKAGISLLYHNHDHEPPLLKRNIWNLK